MNPYTDGSFFLGLHITGVIVCNRQKTKYPCCGFGMNCPDQEPTLQRQNTEISKQIFPEKEYRGLSPNFHIHVSVSELYIPKMELPFLLEEICGPILGIYKSLTDT